eukprot:CAMPEP_0118955508 /NCGR_PEP_ID=MMETSP1169-20130426/60093_1 /TAXON_ID=36882 /ORGANISM="Pyramimonas obovata, Strain CCMP722" /LENGTH=97 /DNA_ID=CAMNT_0006903377 /DNA_START=30 /DNA_END=320 /DNA_ORIENTATION=-
MMEEENEIVRSQMYEDLEDPASADAKASQEQKSQPSRSQAASQQDYNDDELLWMMENEAHESEVQEEMMEDAQPSGGAAAPSQSTAGASGSGRTQPT